VHSYAKPCVVRTAQLCISRRGNYVCR